jgi:hypothetical protein
MATPLQPFSGVSHLPRMAFQIRALFDIRPLCAWPGCPHEPDVQIDYGPAPSGEQLRPPLGWQPAAGGGAITLCDGHAAELRAALETGRIQHVTRL